MTSENGDSLSEDEVLSAVIPVTTFRTSLPAAFKGTRRSLLVSNGLNSTNLAVRPLWAVVIPLLTIFLLARGALWAAPPRPTNEDIAHLSRFAARETMHATNILHLVTSLGNPGGHGIANTGIESFKISLLLDEFGQDSDLYFEVERLEDGLRKVSSPLAVLVMTTRDKFTSLVERVLEPLCYRLSRMIHGQAIPDLVTLSDFNMAAFFFALEVQAPVEHLISFLENSRRLPKLVEDTLSVGYALDDRLGVEQRRLSGELDPIHWWNLTPSAKRRVRLLQFNETIALGRAHIGRITRNLALVGSNLTRLQRYLNWAKQQQPDITSRNVTEQWYHDQALWGPDSHLLKVEDEIAALKERVATLRDRVDLANKADRNIYRLFDCTNFLDCDPSYYDHPPREVVAWPELT